MDVTTLAVSMPKDLFSALGTTRARAIAQLTEFSVVGLYQERRISAGKAAELLEISKAEFIHLLAHKGIPYFDYGAEELAVEFSSLDQWKRQNDNA